MKKEKEQKLGGNYTDDTTVRPFLDISIKNKEIKKNEKEKNKGKKEKRKRGIKEHKKNCRRRKK